MVKIEIPYECINCHLELENMAYYPYGVRTIFNVALKEGVYTWPAFFMRGASLVRTCYLVAYLLLEYYFKLRSLME